MKFFVAFVALVAVAVANPLRPTVSEAEQLEAIVAAIQSPSTDPATAALLEAMLQDLLGVIGGPAIVETPEFETPVGGPAIVETPEFETPVGGPAIIETPVQQIPADQLEAIIAAIQSPSTDPATAAMLEDMLADLLGAGNVVGGPAIVETPEAGNPVAGPALIDFEHHELPVEGSPVVVGPIAEGATPLVQIIVNVKSAAPGAGAGAGAGAPALLPADAPALLPADDVLVVDSAPEQVDDVVIVDDVQVVDTPPSGVAVADLPAPPVAPVAIGTPQLPNPAAVLPDDLN